MYYNLYHFIAISSTLFESQRLYVNINRQKLAEKFRISFYCTNAINETCH